MITFKAFLNEGRNTKELDYEKVVQLLISDYSDSLKLLKDKLYRGVRNRPDMFQYDEASSERTPLSGGLVYTKLLDSNPKNKGWAKRTKSTICTTSTQKAKQFGQVYCVFPKNNTKINYLNEADIWLFDVPFSYENHPDELTSMKLVQFSESLEEGNLNLDGLTVDNLLDRIQENQFLNKHFDAIKDIDYGKILSYDELGAEIITINEYAKKDKQNSEVWFEGPSLMISESSLMWVIEELIEYQKEHNLEILKFLKGK